MNKNKKLCIYPLNSLYLTVQYLKSSVALNLTLVLVILKLLDIFVFANFFGGGGKKLTCSNLDRPRFTKFHP